MFETEAEEYCLKRTGYGRDEFHGRKLRQAFKDGAEFGYNKANEWHFVKDGDLPKDENYVLVSNGKDWTKGFYKDKKWNIISLVGFTKIIVWKEIVLPELKETEK